MELRVEEWQHGPFETLYFGGGTPSVLSAGELADIIEHARSIYGLNQDAEVTLEANPDDISIPFLKSLKAIGINRLSLGIQSFVDRDLKLMNRAHDAEMAQEAIKQVKAIFDNYSLDLIYGIPESNQKEWHANIEMALAFNPPHISAYALTVEPKTALAHQVKSGAVKLLEEADVEAQYFSLLDILEAEGFDNYEFSNFGKQGYFSRNNTAYWSGNDYMGIGPSAHSLIGEIRSWNVSNNSKYIQALSSGQLPKTEEVLTKTDNYNERVMTGLRTINGISLEAVAADFGSAFKQYLLEQAQPLINEHLLYIDDDILYISRQAKFLSDGIASQLFKLNLK